MRRWPAIAAMLLALAATAPAQGQGSSQMQVPPPGQLLRGPMQPDAASVSGGISTPGAAAPAGTAADATGRDAVGRDATGRAAGAPVFMTPLPTPAPRPPSDLLSGGQDQVLMQCKSACSRDYYQCLAGESAIDCPSTWSQCTIACGQAARRSRTLSPLGSP